MGGDQTVQRICGGSDSVKWIQETFLSTRKDNKEIPQLNVLRPKIAVETIVQAVCPARHAGQAGKNSIVVKSRSWQKGTRETELKTLPYLF